MKLIIKLVWQYAKRHRAWTIATFFFLFLLAILWICEPLYSSYAIDQLLSVKQGKVVDFWFIFGTWGALLVVLSLVQAVEKYFSWEMDNRLVLERREDVYGHLLALDVAFHTNHKSGEVIKILDEGADNLMELQRSIFVELGPSMLSSIVFLIISFLIQPLLAGVLITTLSLYIVVVVMGMKRTVKLQQQVNRLWVESIGRAYDAATNIFSVKSNAQHAYELGLMHKSHSKVHRKQQQVNYKWATLEAMNFFMLTRIALIAVGVLLLIQDRLTLGELYFFQFSFFRVLTPFEMLSSLLPNWNKKVGKVRLSEEIMQTPIRVKNKEHPIIIKDVKGHIELKNISFAYDKSDKKIEKELAKLEKEFQKLEDQSNESAAAPELQEQQDLRTEHVSTKSEKIREVTEEEDYLATEVLKNITLDIRPGEHIAFVGHSGAGKSTLVALLNRFYDVTKGKILIDGVDIRDVDLYWWRKNIGLVLQDNVMFNDSIQENIRYARPEATNKEIIDAAKRAAAHEFISKLQHGYSTMIGDRGIRLSGGQRQRIAIARAILKNPKIVVLDEATSALDSVTEKLVQEGIKELMVGRTSCVIAHRLSTVRSVDRIAVFQEGKLLACAPHEELLKTCSVYKEMVKLQSQGMLAEE